MTPADAKRVRTWFVAISFAMMGAGWVFGYLQAIVVRECWFNMACVREVFWAGAQAPPQ